MRLPDLSFLNRRPFERNRMRNFEESRRGGPTVESRPVRAFVEFTTQCPFECPQCYRTVSVRRNQWMSVDMTDQVLAELRRELFPHVFYLLISGTGELFASERWPTYLEALDPFPCYKEVVTSGMMLGPDEARAVADRKLYLSISMDGTSQESYDAYRTGSSHATVVDGVDRVLSLAGGSRLKINFTVMAGNLHELPEMVRFCGDREIKNLDVAPLQVTEPLVEDEAVDYGSPEVHEVFRAAIELAREKRVNLNLPLGGAFLDPHPGSTRFDDDRRALARALRRVFRRDPHHTYQDSQRCTEPWNTILVNVFGDVAPCSVREPIGFLHRQTLPEVWNGEEIQQLRRELLAGRSPGRCATCEKNPRQTAV